MLYTFYQVYPVPPVWADAEAFWKLRKKESQLSIKITLKSLGLTLEHCRLYLYFLRPKLTALYAELDPMTHFH